MINLLLNIIYVLNKKLRLLIINDINIITNNCIIISQRENKDQKDSEYYHNNNCPNCHAKEKDIVNKISDVQGKISVIQTNALGFKSTNSLTTFDTQEINHCNVCGNEWKKFKSKSITKLHILKLALTYLSQILNDPKEREKDWKMETIEVFKDCHAETIYKLSKHNSVETIKLHKLKKHYKSIFK
jgi:hypothetical protein